MNRDSLVSVVMPMHNAAAFLAEAIESVRAQTHRHWELLCLDDGSTDATPAIVADFAKVDGRIHPVRLPHRGIVPTLNDGMRLARGPLVARMDADDVCLPCRFATQLDWFRRHPGLGLIGAAFTVIDAEGKPGKAKMPPVNPNEVRNELAERNCLCHPAMMMRAEVIRRIQGPYREAFTLAEDYDLWLRAVESIEIGNVPQVLLHYRRVLSRANPERTITQTISTLAAQVSARARARRLADPANRWASADRCALRAEGIMEGELNFRIRRALLAEARASMRQGFPESARRLIAAACTFKPRGEGLVRQLDWGWRRWRVAS